MSNTRIIAQWAANRALLSASERRQMAATLCAWRIDRGTWTGSVDHAFTRHGQPRHMMAALIALRQAHRLYRALTEASR